MIHKNIKQTPHRRAGPYLGLLLLVKDEVEVWHDLPQPVEGLVDQLHPVPLLGVGGLPPVLGHPGGPPAGVPTPGALLPFKKIMLSLLLASQISF